MDKITLKELAPYLPYGLNVLSPKHKIKFGERTRLILNGLSFQKSLWDWQYEFVVPDDDLIFGMINDGTYTPLLRPLSSLTKEITHNRETFVPLKRITKMVHDPNNETIFDDESKYEIVDDTFCYPSTDGRNSHYWVSYKPVIQAFEHQETEGSLPQFKLLSLLFEWHFDIFDLIARGRALPMEE